MNLDSLKRVQAASKKTTSEDQSSLRRVPGSLGSVREGSEKFEAAREGFETASDALKAA